MTTAGSGPRTLAVDCGGTGLKATVLDAAGAPLHERVRLRTPYPCPPDVLVDAVVSLARMTGEDFDRVSVGFPGMVRLGVVHATPHYVTEAGPFTEVRPDLLQLWSGFDIQLALESALGRPTRVLNDAEIAGLAVIESKGFEVVLTLGTGLGCALFDDGRLLPKVELSQAPFRKGQSYDEQLGHHARKRLGDKRWSARVAKAVNGLRPVLGWDHLYMGGGGAKHVKADLGPDVTIVGNENGLLGGIRLWNDRAARGRRVEEI
ncbi:ROK family protein [Phytoactinopolyspora alkaliphila]|uniref:ROK family protein n=1 Tax=Phytoactinopolyspora alkaliphila TaxID=1783498 RepID=A0A6N9YTQ5_9ACTN|nr:ROK family protein [Phytoactinopolyspora alkaliphila]NED98426.1 ROK family protein [Phytoactinopolyspora alkaliphila]